MQGLALLTCFADLAQAAEKQAQLSPADRAVAYAICQNTVQSAISICKLLVSLGLAVNCAVDLLTTFPRDEKRNYLPGAMIRITVVSGPYSPPVTFTVNFGPMVRFGLGGSLN